MGLQSLDVSKSLAQLLALNALFDAARQGEGGRQAAQTVQSAIQAVADEQSIDPAADAFFNDCYAALMEGSSRPPRMS